MTDLTINFIAGPFLPIPPIKGGGVEVYLYNLALALAKKHKVRIYSRYYKGLSSHEIVGNLEIVRLIGFNKGGGRLLTALKEFLFGLSVSFNIKKADFNHFFHLKSFLVYLLHPTKGKSIAHLQVAFDGITSKFLKFTDCIVANSEYTAKYFKENGTVKDDKITIIPNGIDIKRFKRTEIGNEIKERYHLTGYKVVGYAGRIAKEKGVESLISAFKILKTKRDDVKLLLIGSHKESEYGEPTFYKYLISRIKDYGFEKDIFFAGLIDHESLPGYYAVCDILAFPSEWEEPFGIVCIEALACGKPVIVTDSGAFREIITNGLNGLVVPKKDPDAIAEKIMLLLNDAQLRERISNIGVKTAESYSFEALAKKYEDLYGRLI